MQIIRAKSRLKRKYNHFKNVIPGFKLGLILVIGGLLSNSIINTKIDDSKVIEPQAKAIEIVYQKERNLDTFIDEAVTKYLNNHYSESKMIMHCLAHRESRHGESKAMGDGGLAGGTFQFHEETWQRMRKQMLKEGLIREIGSRFNDEQAAHTTAWAISKGRAKEWGPLARYKNGSDFAVCQYPSWYKE